MKLLNIIGCIVCLTMINIQITKAQKGYINVNGGYGFSFASQTLGTNLTSNSVTAIKGTFGKGVNFGGSVGYLFKEHFGLELGVNYILGSKYMLSNTSTYSVPETVNLNGKMLKFIPALKIIVGENTKGYARIGLVLGVLNKIVMDDDYTGYSQYSSQRTLTTEVYSGRISFGLNTALGIEKMTTEHFGFFAEINSTTQSWAPKRSEYTKYEVNGVNQLPNMSTNEKQVEYVSSYDPNATPVSSAPRKQIKSYFPFSNIGITLGIKIIFGNKEK